MKLTGLFCFLSFFVFLQSCAVENSEPKRSALVAADLEEEEEEASKFYSAGEPFFQYTGRVDFSDPLVPRFWASGVYIKATFEGNSCEILINDEVLWGNSHNYISVVIDDNPPVRIKLTGKENKLLVAEDLPEGPHTLMVVKDTESGIGYLDFIGLKCKKLLEPTPRPKRKIEFYGNSITCGTGSDLSEIACDQGEWYDQHNAYMSYGPVTARLLDAEWMLTSVSGIGLIHSCCDMDIVMADVYDKLNARNNSGEWDFRYYQPDVITITLGQNDGIQDPSEFVAAYVSLITNFRRHYPDASIVCLTSPMADEALLESMRKNLNTIIAQVHKKGDKSVHAFFYEKKYNNGCGGHPDLAQHTEIANELANYIKKLKNW